MNDTTIQELIQQIPPETLKQLFPTARLDWVTIISLVNAGALLVAAIGRWLKAIADGGGIRDAIVALWKGSAATKKQDITRQQNGGWKPTS
jgi:hypothetical protein